MKLLRLWVTSFIDKAQENGYNCLILNSHGSLEQELKILPRQL